MTNILLYLIFFITGVTVVFLFYKAMLKKWSLQLRTNIDKITSAETTVNDDPLPGEFDGILEKVKSLVEKQTQISPNEIPQLETHDNNILLQKLVDNLYIVNELGQNLTSSLNLRETFQHLFSTINSMMDAAVLELNVFNDATKTWKIISNQRDTGATDSFTLVNHLVEWCFINNREVFLADAEHDFERYVSKPLIMQDGRMAKSVMVFPILNQGMISGTLCVISFQINMFEEFHRKIIRLLLGYIAVAMQNALTHEELNTTKQRAERSEKFMQQFLANMSHEIRTPIHAVTGMTRLLLEKDPKQEQLKYLESIRNASDSLLVIINDILDLSKIEAGKIEFEEIDFSVLDTVENVKEIMQFKAEEKGLLLETHFDEKIPPILIGDSIRLTQVLINLVGNAVKFTDKGSVKLSVTRLEIAANDNLPTSICSLRFNISDTGIGMTLEQQEKLFQNYAQASTDTTRKYGGTGLGLSISKQLVQLQHGTIEVKSLPGEGSTFSFTLSYPVSKNNTIARKEKVISKEMLDQLKGIKILLADDNEYNRIVAKETLQLKIENVRVEEAMDGEMAVQMVRKNEYDIVIMDLVMPKMNGLEATSEIRNRLPAPKNKIKIVALTASVVKSEIDKCFASGMNGFIPKPFKSYELLGVIYSVIHSNEEVAFEGFSLKNHAPKSTEMLIDLESLREFTEGDTERMQRYVDLFLAKIPESMASLNAALDKRDYEKMRISAHSLKPQLHATGVLTGLAIAEKIEQHCMEKTDPDQLPELIKQLNKICDSALEEMKAINTSQMN